MKRVAVFTSGGDAPGMNAAIRAVVRTGIYKGWDMYGIRYGYQGLMNGDMISLGARDVGAILERGGTILRTARCPDFETPAGQLRGVRSLQENGIEGVIVIGGNGTQAGAYALSQMDVPVVGIASTIDNDLYGSDVTIGVDTALNIALEAIDRLKVTASSHQRAFVVEVMGRNSGYLALMAGLAGGAETIIIPEVPCNPEAVVNDIRSAYRRGKAHALIVVAEGAEHCNVDQLGIYFKEHREEVGFELRTTRLGHVQRGGVPTCFDRLLATRLAAGATDCMAEGKYGVLVGLIKDEIAATPLATVVENKKKLDLNLLKLAMILAK